jgi:transposase
MMQEKHGDVTGGVDTHADVHVGAVVNTIGVIIATASFSTTTAGYEALLTWMRSFGTLQRVGVEGTGSYGAGLTRYLHDGGVVVVEINRPNRQHRRRRGKSDTADAEAAARAALNGEATGTPKTGTGRVESIRTLRTARRSAVKAMTQAGNQIRDLIVTAPDSLRERLASLDTAGRVNTCSGFRLGTADGVEEHTKHALRTLARRHRFLAGEIAELDTSIHELCVAENHGLLGVTGVGPDVAAALLIAAGDNPARMRTEASFAALCGASAVEASSGKIVRHRLNRGGNRDANNALWRIVMIRLRHHPETRAYRDRRRTEGKTDREIVRCLKRYVAREIFLLLTKPPAIPNGANLRTARTAIGMTLTTVAAQLATPANRLSDLERGIIHNNHLATAYQAWLHTQKAA